MWKKTNFNVLCLPKKLDSIPNFHIFFLLKLYQIPSCTAYSFLSKTMWYWIHLKNPHFVLWAREEVPTAVPGQRDWCSLWRYNICSIWVCLKMVSTPLYPMVLLIIIPMKNGYFIGNINLTFSDKPICRCPKFPKSWYYGTPNHPLN